MTLNAGTKLGRYEILSKIGRGRNEVYRAEDLELCRKLAGLGNHHDVSSVRRFIGFSFFYADDRR